MIAFLLVLIAALVGPDFGVVYTVKIKILLYLRYFLVAIFLSVLLSIKYLIAYHFSVKLNVKYRFRKFPTLSNVMYHFLIFTSHTLAR